MDNTNKVLRLFDIEIKEEFNILDNGGINFAYNPYYFDKKMNLRDKNKRNRNNFISGLITGDFKIKKIKESVYPVYCRWC